MTRKSKIARLPRSIRDELNHRLDNGQPGLHLVEWLNNLPETKEILAREFQSRRITPQNLSEWKRGGYRNWVAQQEHAATLQDFLADAKELGEAATPEKLSEAIFNLALVHYAAATYESMYRPEHRDNLNHWSQMLNDVIRLRNSDLARERFDLDTQKLAFNEEKLRVQTELAHQRLDLDRARLELSSQKVTAQLQETRNRRADIASRRSLPAKADPVRRIVNDQEVPSPSNVGATSPSPIGWERAGVRAHNPAKTPLEINMLQPNPTKSNHPFFIFPQTLTVGQASCLSPSFFVQAHDEKPPAPLAFWTSLALGNTQHLSASRSTDATRNKL